MILFYWIKKPLAPKEYSYPIYDELKVDGKPKWLKRAGYCKIIDEWFYVSYGMEGLQIVANGGGYEVELPDVIKAKKLESAMDLARFSNHLIPPAQIPHTRLKHRTNCQSSQWNRPSIRNVVREAE